MSPTSTTDQLFLATLENWLHGSEEVLVFIRRSRAAGDKSFEFFTSFAKLAERLRHLDPETCITAFKSHQLPIRGLVDEEFIRGCLVQIRDGSEFLLIEIVPRTAGRASWYHHEAGTSRLELKAALEDSFGVHVAVGQYPPWLEDGPNVISGYVPDATGKTKIGVY
jgi:hypothetical protein